MGKGDTSLLRVTDEVGNLFLNSNLRYFRHKLNAPFLPASNFLTYNGPDRFTVARTGVANPSDAGGRSTEVPESRFQYSLYNTRDHQTSGQSGHIFQKIESSFSRRLFLEGKASFSFYLRPEFDTYEILISIVAPNAADDWASETTVFSKTLTKDVDFTIDQWDLHKIEDVDVPLLGEGGFGLRITQRVNDALAFPQTSKVFVTGFQCNEGSKVLDWRLMRGDELAELETLKRYLRKSYKVDVDPGSNTLDGIVTGRHDNTGLMSNHAPRVDFEPEMRVDPSITPYDAVGNDNAFSSSTGGTVNPTTNNEAVGSILSSSKGIRAITYTGGVTVHFFHYVALAEL